LISFGLRRREERERGGQMSWKKEYIAISASAVQAASISFLRSRFFGTAG